METKAFDPATYSGPILPAGSNSVSWAGRATYQQPRPDGNRFAQSQWQLTMSGAVGHESPHAAYFTLSSDQQAAFDHPGQLPFNLFSSSPAAAGPSGGAGGPQRHIEEAHPPSPPRPPSSAPSCCSQCGAASSSIKRIRTHGGLMRSLCNNCVYDMAGGDQGAFGRMWADGCPL